LSSVAQSAVNLAKNIIGSGMFALPAGVAAFSGSPKALVPSVAFTLLLGVLSAYGFVLIADACNRTGETTYQGSWGKAIGHRSKWVPAVACIAKAGIGCISYSMILGDCLSLLLKPLSFPAAISSRSAVMLALTVLVLLPLCSMKSLAPLAKFSFLGVLSNVFIAIVIAFRSLDGSYRAGGALAAAAPAAAEFVPFTGSPWATVADPGFAVLLCMLSTAFIAHYNAPVFYEELAPGPDGRKDGRFLLVSVIGFSIAAIILSTVMSCGFLTFGRASLGLILDNYAATDRLAVAARIAIVVSLTTTQPLVFFSLRRQLVDLFGHRGAELAERWPTLLTISLLAVVTLIALVLHDLGKLTAFAGACFGSFLIYIAPAAMVLYAERRGLGPRGSLLARCARLATLPLGAALGILGAIQSLK